MCIIDIKPNENFIVKNIQGGTGLVRRLRDLGFVSGEKVKMIKNDRSGPILIDVKGSTIALGRGVASKIFGEKDESKA